MYEYKCNIMYEKNVFVFAYDYIIAILYDNVEMPVVICWCLKMDSIFFNKKLK